MIPPIQIALQYGKKDNNNNNSNNNNNAKYVSPTWACWRAWYKRTYSQPYSESTSFEYGQGY
jgi:hypothetical protein